ncbi:hypothetical protein SAMN06297251_10161 [Fulvimarina manganoxydans]|uniref:Uncharacterized protein n=1 Tax=Fulvimarina manganoxydans TaxID=937218 RepID=A0A1W1Y909_9HYPH|nr:hypothetical protein [Fulvimarina manganoxydans]SMC32647.1 hypothetical protein SAMN06297251_10161 [Fulvimarina manganoxydans]
MTEARTPRIANFRGVLPCNNFLYPTESWNAQHEVPEVKFHDWRMFVIHLEDGRWATNGFVWNIAAGVDQHGDPCVFPNRSKAIRASAAALVARARYRMGLEPGMTYHASSEQGALVIDWARRVVERETKGRTRQMDLFGGVAA